MVRCETHRNNQLEFSEKFITDLPILTSEQFYKLTEVSLIKPRLCGAYNNLKGDDLRNLCYNLNRFYGDVIGADHPQHMRLNIDQYCITWKEFAKSFNDNVDTLGDFAL